MNVLSNGVEHSSACTGRTFPTPFVKCSASTSGRPFGSAPCIERGQCRRWSSGESLSQPLPTSLRLTRRFPCVEAVRESKQDRSKRSSEQATVSPCLRAAETTPFYPLLSSTGTLLQTKPGEQNTKSHSRGYLGGIVNDLLYGVGNQSGISAPLRVPLVVLTGRISAGCKQNGKRSDHMHQVQRLWLVCLSQLQGMCSAAICFKDLQDIPCHGFLRLPPGPSHNTSPVQTVLDLVQGVALLQHSMLHVLVAAQHSGHAFTYVCLLTNAACVLDTIYPWLVQGQGVVQPNKLKKAADPVRQAANMVSSMLGGSNSSEYNSHMLRSNRQGSATMPRSH